MFMVNTGKYTSPMDPIIVRNTHMFQLGCKKDNTNNSRYIVNQIIWGMIHMIWKNVMPGWQSFLNKLTSTFHVQGGFM